MVLTASSETIPSTTKRGLLTIRSVKRTAIAITATVVIQYATTTISTIIRIGSTTTETAYTSQKVLPAPT